MAPAVFPIFPDTYPDTYSEPSSPFGKVTVDEVKEALGPDPLFPDVELVDLAYKLGLSEVALANALTALVTYGRTQEVAQLRIARWWLDYRILRESHNG